MREGSKLKKAWCFLRDNRKAILRYGVIAAAIVLPVGVWLYLQPATWKRYTDEIELSCTSRSVTPQYVMWDSATELNADLGAGVGEPAVSPDGTMMAFSRATSGNSDLFVAIWDGAVWNNSAPMRAVNSQFNERSPVFSRDGKIIYFSTDRPGGPGGYDIWVARWDGAEFSWPVPLTSMVNSPYDDLGPAPSADGAQLFFSSNRPREKEIKEEDVEFIIEGEPDDDARDFDIFSANAIPAGVTNREVERATSMLYYLRESALSDDSVMRKLGGSRKIEESIDRALDYLAKRQHADGRWSVPAKGDKHDVAITSLSMLAFFGRGNRHDRPGKYQDNLTRGLKWLTDQQKPLGDLSGKGDFYDHAMGTLALGEAYGLSKDESIFDAAHTAIDFIVECQNKDGGWRYKKGESPSDLSVSGWMIMALKNAQLSGLYVPSETFDGIREFLETVAGGNQGGFFGYQNKSSGTGQPAMRVTGYFCSQLMGLSPNTLRSFEAADIMATRGADIEDFYYMYYGTLAANQHQGPIWKKWREKSPELLLPAQNADGSWTARGRHAADMGNEVGTALATLSLQAHYRYTPMYGLGYEPDQQTNNLAALTRDELPEVPLYRLAKRRYRLSSRGDDIDPIATKHGDFLYFASDRRGGHGGLDIYRSRISGEKPTKPENVGPAINSSANESSPVSRMAGFNLVFISDRGGENDLYSSISRRVRIEYDTGNRPSVGWFARTFPWRILLIVLSAAALTYWVRVWRRRMKPLVLRSNLSRSMLVVNVCRRWLVPVVSVLVLLGCMISVRSTLYKTVWCFYTDGQGLRRNALVDTVRPVLWSTHLTYGSLNKLRNEVIPEFSRDETEVLLTPVSAEKVTAQPLLSKWDGTQWQEARPAHVNAVASNDAPSGGGYQFFAAQADRHGRRDLYMGRTRHEGDAENLGILVNSKLDDAEPAVRMEGFDLMFASNRGQKNPEQYLLYTSSAREVFTRMNYARWHSFVAMLNRIKWWVLALAGAIWGLCYLLKHMEDLTSLFHKCLLGSVAVHLLVLLLMAGWIISTEFLEAIESTTMEMSVDVNALAQEKLALELEADITDLADVTDTAKVEKSQDAPDIPMLNPEVVEDVPDIVAELPEYAFIEDVKTAATAESTKDQINSKALDPLANLEMAMLKVKPVLEEMQAEDTKEKEEVADPVVEQAVEFERREVEKVQAEAEEVESQVPELARAELDKAAHELSAQRGEAKPLPEEPIEAAVVDALKDVPEFKPVKVELEAAGGIKSVEKEGEFKPATAQEQLEIDRAKEQKVETAAVGGAIDPATVAVSVDTNSMTSAAVGEFAPESSKETVSLDAPDSLMPEQIIADVRGSDIRAELEVVSRPAPSRETRPEVDAAAVAAAGVELSVERVTEGTATIEALELAVQPDDVVSAPISSRSSSQPAMSAAGPAELEAASPTDVAALSGLMPDTMPQATAPLIARRLLETPAGSRPSGGKDSFVPNMVFGEVAAVRVRTGLPSAGAVLLSVDDGEIIGAPPVSAFRLAATVGPQDPLSGSVVESAAPRALSALHPAQSEYAGFIVGPRVMMEGPDAPTDETGPGSFEPEVSQEGAHVARAASVAPMPGGAVLPRNMDVDLNPDSSVVRGGGTSLSDLQVGASAMREEGSDIPSLEIASMGPGLRIGVVLPGKLSIPAGYDRTAIPEIMKDPSKLSDEVIAGLGGSGKTQASIRSALDWFTENQASDGRWSLGKHGGNSAHDVGGTSLAVLCYYGWGAKHTKEGPHQKTVRKAIDWLVSQMQEDGDLRGWSKHRYEENELLGNMYDHAIATIALCEAYGLTKDEALLEPSRKAVAFLLASQEKELGGWRYDPEKDSDTSVLGWAYMALKSAELAGIDVPAETFERADKWLNRVSGGKFGGIYGYQKPEDKRAAMVATGMFCRQLQGVPATDPRMHEGVGYIATHPLDPKDLDYYYMYYATLVMYQNQGSIWEEWNERMKETLLSAQHKSGSKRGTWDPQMWYGFQMGRVASTAISTLSLEVYYRILPIYGFGVEGAVEAE